MLGELYAVSLCYRGRTTHGNTNFLHMARHGIVSSMRGRQQSRWTELLYCNEASGNVTLGERISVIYGQFLYQSQASELEHKTHHGLWTMLENRRGFPVPIPGDVSAFYLRHQRVFYFIRPDRPRIGA